MKLQVQVLDRHGNEIVEFREALSLEQADVDADIAAAVGGWHRAKLARRAFAWAGSTGRDREAALLYAVDLGVLLPGVAAIAIPANQRETLGMRLRRLYSTDGVPLGAVLRIPRSDDFRANICVGGSTVAAELDDDDRRIIEQIRPALQADGLAFVGIDVVDGQLIEVNVTSPTGLRELARLTGTDPAGAVIRRLEREST